MRVPEAGGPGDFREANLRTLEVRFPELARLLRKTAPADLETVPAASGDPTARVSGRFLHSRYDPEGEARKAAASVSASGADTVVILGLGLGYAAQAALSELPGARIVTAEADPAFLSACLGIRDLGALLADDRVSLLAGGEPEGLLWAFERLETRKVRVLENKAETELYPEWYARAQAVLARWEDKEAINVNTLRRFGRLWVRNLARNLDEIPRRPGCLRPGGLARRDCPAVIAAAGPSLDEILPRLPRTAGEGRPDLRGHRPAQPAPGGSGAGLRRGRGPAVLERAASRPLRGSPSPSWSRREPSGPPCSACVSRECGSAPRSIPWVPSRRAVPGLPRAGWGPGAPWPPPPGTSPVSWAAVPCTWRAWTWAFPGAAPTPAPAASSRSRLPRAAACGLRRRKPVRGRHRRTSPGRQGKRRGDGRTDERLSLYSWWFENRMLRHPECPTRNLSAGGLAIAGMPFDHPDGLRDRVRDRIDSVMDEIRREGKTGPGGKAGLPDVRGEILGLLEGMEAKAESALEWTDRARELAREGRDPCARPGPPGRGGPGTPAVTRPRR